MINQIYGRTAPANGTIWDKFSEHHQHQSIKKDIIFNTQLSLLVQIRCIFNAYF